MRTIKPLFETHTFADANFVALPTIVGVDIVSELEMRNTGGNLQIRDSVQPSKIDTYAQDEVYKLNKTARAGVTGYDISSLEVAGAAAEILIAEFHI